MPQLIPVEHDPFDLAGQLAPYANGQDRLVPPPANPFAPPEWLARPTRSLAEGLGNMIAMPKRAMEQGVTTEDAIPWGANVGIALMGGASPFAPKGAAGIFGGRLAATADQQALTRAEELAKAGASRENIWNETGWFQGADGKWRFEISDRNSKFTPGEHMQRSFLDQTLDHPELYAAYPDLAGIPVKYKSYSREGAYWEPKTPTRKATERMVVPTQDFIWPDSARGTALHEAQHAVQYREGFAAGGNPEELLSLATVEGAKAGSPLSPKELAYEAYRRLAGETEARNVDRRKTYFSRAEAHDVVPPWTTEDVPRAKQTVRGVRLIPVGHDPFR